MQIKYGNIAAVEMQTSLMFLFTFLFYYYSVLDLMFLCMLFYYHSGDKDWVQAASDADEDLENCVYKVSYKVLQILQ